MNDENISLIKDQEKYFFETFPLIQRIAVLKVKPYEIMDCEDISQEVKLSVLIWKRNRPDNQYTQEEWLKFVNRVTNNKIKSLRRSEIKNTIPLAETDENQIFLLAKEKPQIAQNTGNTTMELHLLISQMWTIIQTQTRLGQYALLLKNAELTSSLIYYRGCRISEMAKKMQLTEAELGGIIENLPLSDKQIVSFLFKRFQLKATPAAIRKARQRAIDELQTAIRVKQKARQHGKLSKSGKT